MEFLTIGIILYLVIGALVGSITVLTKSGQNLINEASYKMPITHSKVIWFATIMIFWVIVLSGIRVKWTHKKGKPFRIKTNVKWSE